MKVRDINKLIPSQFRDKILEENLVYKAIAIPEDRHMKILFTIWTTYVEPGRSGDGDCRICLSNILDNYRAIQDDMVLLAKEEKLLDL